MLFPDFKFASAQLAPGTVQPGAFSAREAFRDHRGRGPFEDNGGGHPSPTGPGGPAKPTKPTKPAKPAKPAKPTKTAAMPDPGQAVLGALLGMLLGRVASSTMSGYAQPARDAALGAAVAMSLARRDGEASEPEPGLPAHWKPL